MVLGLQVPVMPSRELAGSSGGTEFWHTDIIQAKVGVIWLVISIPKVVVAPHCPAFGVKV